MENIYELYHSWYEDFSSFLFYFPVPLTQEEWTAKTQGLVDASVKKILEENEHGWIGWQDIVNNMVGLLEEQGFTRIKTIQSGFWGGNIIDDAEDAVMRGDHFCEKELKSISEPILTKLLAHNQKIRDKIHKRR